MPVGRRVDVGGRSALATQDTISLFFSYRTPAETRALGAAVLAGAALGLAVGGAYLVSGQASRAADQARVERPADAAATGYAVAPPLAPPPPRPLGSASAPIAPALTAATSPPRRAELARDLDCLATAVYYEARGEAVAGQAAVAQVVLNRAHLPAFPKDVCAVVYQGRGGHACQFSFVCDGAMSRLREPAAWARARAVAGRALDGYVMTAVGRADAFHAARRDLAWAGRGVQLGGQVFYVASAQSSVARPRQAQPAASTMASTAPADHSRLTFALGVLTRVNDTPDAPATAGGGT